MKSGQRWAVDGGRDDYSLPGYFDKERYRYFRTGTEGHNTLIFDTRNQPLTAKQRLRRRVFKTETTISLWSILPTPTT